MCLEEYNKQSILHDAVKNDSSEMEIRKTLANLQTMVGKMGVDIAMKNKKLDAIGILMDSPICTISAATGESPHSQARCVQVC